MDNPDQPPEGVTDVPPSLSNDEEPPWPSPGLQRSGHHHVLSTCAVHVLASPACHIRPGNAGGGAASGIIAIKTALWQFSKKSYCVLVHGPRLKSKKLTKCDGRKLKFHTKPHNNHTQNARRPFPLVVLFHMHVLVQVQVSE